VGGDEARTHPLARLVTPATENTKNAISRAQAYRSLCEFDAHAPPSGLVAAVAGDSRSLSDAYSSAGYVLATPLPTLSCPAFRLLAKQGS